MAEGELKSKEQVAAADSAAIKVTIDVGAPRFARVKVLNEDGIFKNGNAYAKGDEAIISLSAAQGFEAAGEVEIIGEIDSEATPDEVFTQHGIVTPAMEQAAQGGKK